MVKKSVKQTEKDGVSVQQFADDIGVTAERLISQFKDAGITISSAQDHINEEQKQLLLRYLQNHHGAKQASKAPEKIVVRRAKTSQIKLGDSKISVQVKKKRTFVKRAVVEEPQEPVVETPTPAAPEPEVLKEAAPADKPKVEEVPKEVSATEPAQKEEVKEPQYTEEKPEAPAAVTEEEAKANKRKEKPKEAEETEVERTKKKKKSRDQSRERNIESLLSRGADLSKVLKSDDDEYGDAMRRGGRARGGMHGRVKTQAFTRPTSPQIHEVEVPETIAISDLAMKMSVKAAEIIKVMMKLGTMATINQVIDQDTALLVIEEMGHKAKPVSSDAVEERLLKLVEVEGNKEPRPPVITIMGHVDHGKTTLLDYIRTTKVAASEAGGITQHIGAYHVQTDKGTITFLDTPGHAAFTAMRARGAKLTDIVILVVAADDGVMPQTVEAIQHAKAANVPIVIAVNKMDKPNIDPDRVKTELTKYNLIPEEWGGDTMFVPISAKMGTGVDNLLDSVLVQAEILELKSIADAPAKGVVIESRLDRGRGAVMSVLVQQGTLYKGDIILAGSEYGRIRALFDETGKAIDSAGPSIPAEVLGLSGVPQSGDDFLVVPDEKKAREVALFRQNKFKEAKFANKTPKLEDLLQRIEEEKTGTTLNILIKADVLGSIEALKQALTELSGQEVKVNIISSGIGGISESDVNLAIASKAIIIAFNVRANVEARKLMETNGVDVHYHNIIYDVINDVKKAISGALAPEIQEKVIGLAQVREVFKSSKTGTIAGCMVLEGIVKRNLPIRVLRDNVVIFTGTLESLRRFKEDVSEVRAGMECGIAVKNYNDVKVSDQIEVFERIEIKREI